MKSEFWSCEEYDAEAQRRYDDGDYAGAIHVTREGLARYPECVELHVSLGYAYLAREEFAWARRSFERALSLSPDHEEALAGVGEVLLKLGERSRAFVVFERLLELGFGADAELMLCVGRALVREGLVERAERFFHLGLQADGGCADAAQELACAHYRRGDMKGAASWARHALELDPGHEEARAFYGNLLYEQGRYSAALEQLGRLAPSSQWDPVVIWRTVELLRRFRDLDASAPELSPYVERLERLSVRPSPEERLLAEMEALHGTGPGATARSNPGQLDLFGWISGEWGSRDLHRVRAPDGRVYEGDWQAIVRAMRDRSSNPGVSLAAFMREQARRLEALTGVTISHEDPKTFIEESARAGALRIER
ncbi:MAG: tetratricopeptide repeat protein [Gemmatimonadota bacterium]